MQMKSNYEIMRDSVQVNFLEYDQKRMIEKFHLNCDREYLYIKFVDRMHRINRRTGRVEWSEDSFKTIADADYNEAMSIYDILCCSKDDCHLSGRFTAIHQLKGIVCSSGTGESIFSWHVQYLGDL